MYIMGTKGRAALSLSNLNALQPVEAHRIYCMYSSSEMTMSELSARANLRAEGPLCVDQTDYARSIAPKFSPARFT